MIPIHSFLLPVISIHKHFHLIRTFCFLIVRHVATARGIGRPRDDFSGATDVCLGVEGARAAALAVGRAAVSLPGAAYLPDTVEWSPATTLVADAGQR